MIKHYSEHDRQENREQDRPTGAYAINDPQNAEQPSKHQMIEASCQRNRSAKPEFLSDFDEQTLASYLQRLTRLTDRRGRDSVWVREGSARSVVTRAAS